jgi:hypothetical protein
MRGAMKRPFSREQRLTIIHGMLIFVLIIVVLQLWLLTATMNAWLGGDDAIVWPAAAASAACLALNAGLLRYLVRAERTRKGGSWPASSQRPPPLSERV